MQSKSALKYLYKNPIEILKIVLVLILFSYLIKIGEFIYYTIKNFY